MDTNTLLTLINDLHARLPRHQTKAISHPDWQFEPASNKAFWCMHNAGEYHPAVYLNIPVSLVASPAILRWMGESSTIPNALVIRIQPSAPGDELGEIEIVNRQTIPFLAGDIFFHKHGPVVYLRKLLDGDRVRFCNSYAESQLNTDSPFVEAAGWWIELQRRDVEPSGAKPFVVTVMQEPATPKPTSAAPIHDDPATDDELVGIIATTLRDNTSVTSDVLLGSLTAQTGGDERVILRCLGRMIMAGYQIPPLARRVPTNGEFRPAVSSRRALELYEGQRDGLHIIRVKDVPQPPRKV